MIKRSRVVSSIRIKVGASRGTESLHDSPLEGTGFELSVLGCRRRRGRLHSASGRAILRQRKLSRIVTKQNPALVPRCKS